MDFCFTHDFDIDAGDFWPLFFSAGYSEALYQALQMRSRELLVQEDDGATIRRVQRFEPSFPMPSWAGGAVKSTAYTEHDLYRRERSAMEVRIEPALRTERFRMGGVYSVAPLGPGRCRREFRGEVNVAVPLLGGRIERAMVEQLRGVYETAARVTRDWIRRAQEQQQTR